MESNIVVVPNLTAFELAALTKRELDLTYLNNDYERWDYYTDLKGQPIRGRGLKFKVFLWKPELKEGWATPPEAVRKHFGELQAFGHVGAFIQWRRTCGLQGRYLSIPEDSACRSLSDGRLSVPFSCFVNGMRSLTHLCISNRWDHLHSFVAFKLLND